MPRFITTYRVQRLSSSPSTSDEGNDTDRGGDDRRLFISSVGLGVPEKSNETAESSPVSLLELGGAAAVAVDRVVDAAKEVENPSGSSAPAGGWGDIGAFSFVFFFLRFRGWGVGVGFGRELIDIMMRNGFVNPTQCTVLR